MEPVEEALHSGTLALPAHPVEGMAPPPLPEWGDSATVGLLIILSVCLVIAYLRSLMHILPVLVKCFFRVKDNLSLEGSMRLSSDRDISAVVCIAPFCLVASRFNLYAPRYLEGMRTDLSVLVVIGVFLAWLLLRKLMQLALQPRRSRADAYNAAIRVPPNFFVLGTVLLVAVCPALLFFGANELTVRETALITLGVLYAVMNLREWQILHRNCSFFTAFLYLCGLEWFPTAAMVASALLF